MPRVPNVLYQFTTRTGSASLERVVVAEVLGQAKGAWLRMTGCCMEAAAWIPIAHAADASRCGCGTRASKETGTCRHTWIAKITVVASNKAPTATWATVAATMGNSGCAAFLPQATRVTNAVKPRQSCVISSDSIRMAGRRTAAIFE